MSSQTTLIECVECHEAVDVDGTYTDPLGRGGDICGACIDHLDAREWTKRTLLSHMYAHDSGFHYTSADTKAVLVTAHEDKHLDEWRRAQAAGES